MIKLRLKMLGGIWLFLLGVSPAWSRGIVTAEAFGAVGDGVYDDTKAVQAALHSGNDISLTKLYAVTEINTEFSGQRLSGGGTLKAIGGKKGNLLVIRQPNVVVTNLTFDTSLGNLHTLLIKATNVQVTSNIFKGQVGHWILGVGSDASGLQVLNNTFDGAGFRQTAPVVVGGVKNFKIIDNEFQDVTGFNIQTRGSQDGLIAKNNFRNPTYFSQEVIASATQNTFTFTLPADTFRQGLRINGIVTPTWGGPIPSSSYAKISHERNGLTYNATLTDNKGNSWVKVAAGDKVQLLGWRSLENININAGSKNIQISENTIDGSGDGGIVAVSDYNIARQIDPAHPANLPEKLIITNNKISNISAACIAILNRIADVKIAGNRGKNCGAGTGSHFSTCIFVAGDDSGVAPNNICGVTSTGITKYQVVVNGKSPLKIISPK
jgi:hypothetical protein